MRALSSVSPCTGRTGCVPRRFLRSCCCSTAAYGRLDLSAYIYRQLPGPGALSRGWPDPVSTRSLSRPGVGLRFPGLPFLPRPEPAGGAMGPPARELEARSGDLRGVDFVDGPGQELLDAMRRAGAQVVGRVSRGFVDAVKCRTCSPQPSGRVQACRHKRANHASGDSGRRRAADSNRPKSSAAAWAMP
jgi:hypothetical protein